MAKALTSSQRRTYRTRNKLRRVNINRVGNRETRPRLSVHRTGKQIYAQIICDIQGKTLAAASTLEADIKDKVTKTWGVDAASTVGKVVAERAKKAGVEKVVFDRGRFLYHGRIKALADSAREAGLSF